MRITNPKNHKGQKLLSTGDLVEQSREVSETIVDGRVNIEMPDADEWVFSRAIVDGIVFLPEVTENAGGGASNSFLMKKIRS